MKLRLFNRPYVGSHGRIDPVSLFCGAAAVVSVIASYPWIFMG